MDLAYWGFSRWPFQRQVMADSPSVGSSYDEALARLMFLVDEHRSCGLLSGTAGIGKTRLLRHVQDYSRRRGRCCFDVNATGINGAELAFQLASRSLPFGDADATPVQCWAAIEQHFRNLALVHQPTVVLIDHANLADSDLAVAIRRLMNLAEHVASRLTVLVAGRDTAVTAEVADVAELSVEVTAWSHEEVARFVSESLLSAAAHTDLFSSEAIAAIGDLSGGVPGDVIRICDLALLAAMNDDRHLIDAGLVESAALELSPRRRHPADRRFVQQVASVS